MWITLLLLCLGVIFCSKAQQQTSFESQTITETTYPNHGVKWDSTRPPVTLSIHNGRSDNSSRPVNDEINQPLFYSNQWQPLLLPIGFNTDGDSNNHQTENEYSIDHQFVPTLLHRPDSEVNQTVPSNSYPQTGERNDFSSVPIPLTPIFFYPTQHQSYADEYNNGANANSNQNASVPELRPATSRLITSSAEVRYGERLQAGNVPVNSEGFHAMGTFRNTQGFIQPLPFGLYPTQSNLFPNGNDQGTTKNNKPMSSAPVSKPVTSNAREKLSEASPAEKFSWIPERFQSMNFYRNIPGFVPPMAPAFFPSYPFLPLMREGNLPPITPYQTNDPNFDREIGSDTGNRPRTALEKQATSANRPDNFSETIPSETSNVLLPRQPLPFPVGGFPFGVLPPPSAMPFIPNIPTAGALTFNSLPLSQPGNVPEETIISDPVPISPVIPSSGTSPFNSLPLPQLGNLPKETIIRNPVPLSPVIPSSEPIPPQVYPESGTGAGLLADTEIPQGEIAAAEVPDAPKIPYEFGYNMNDGKGNDQHRKEVSDEAGVVTGSYGYRDVFGVYRLVNYRADKDGFRAYIKSNEPGVASSGSAHVMVMAEQPPPTVVDEGIKSTAPAAIVFPDETADLLTAGSSTETQ